MKALLEVVKFETNAIVTTSACAQPGQVLDECDPEAE